MALLLDRYRAIRAHTEALAAPLSPEDQQVQSMPECSPTKWHRGHTTWFFETFVLAYFESGYHPVHPQYSTLFNSYYESVGPRHERPARGVLSRPTAAEVLDYRVVVDERMSRLLAAPSPDPELAARVELGLAHEEQHQELILTDILHAFSRSPLRPAYHAVTLAEPVTASLTWRAHAGGLCELGASADGFAFDHERPRHRVWLEPFALASRLVTYGELRAFIDAGGYREPLLWLSAGWDWVRENQLEAPEHTTYRDGELRVFTLAGERPAADDEAVAHLSYFEADALARFLGARLPTEHEWEVALPESGARWEWTSSAFTAYPGYTPAAGALGEYNGKFMVNQLVLRGGSRFTPPGHLRPSYRNFWPPATRFQLTGARLARSGA